MAPVPVIPAVPVVLVADSSKIKSPYFRNLLEETMSSILFGGASLGEGAFSTDGSMTAIYDALDAAKISRIDTARRYPKSSPGCSEQLLGSTGAIKRGFAIDTKINVMSVGQSGGSLSKKKIEESVAASLVALRDDQVGIKPVFPVLRHFFRNSPRKTLG